MTPHLFVPLLSTTHATIALPCSDLILFLSTHIFTRYVSYCLQVFTIYVCFLTLIFWVLFSVWLIKEYGGKWELFRRKAKPVTYFTFFQGLFVCLIVFFICSQLGRFCCGFTSNSIQTDP
jgi:hypothetical protein